MHLLWDVPAYLTWRMRRFR